MIPLFPDFIKLSPDLNKHLEKYTKKFPPYSDHNFTSLLMWDVSGDTEFSILNDNLVIKFRDYESEKKFFSFIGNNLVEDTIEKLIAFSENQGFGNNLLLLPKDNFSDEEIEKLSLKYELTEDRDNYDYILSSEELAEFKGTSFLNKRNKLNKFLKTYTPKIVIKSPEDEDFQKDLNDCLNDWVEITKTERGEKYVNYDELKAFKKLIDNHKHLNLIIFAVYIEDKIRGFSIVETIDEKYAHHPFQKGNIKYRGIYEYLYNSIGKYLKEKNIGYLNIYQDMGHEGLRTAKMDYNPTFLKKYKLGKKSAN